MTNQDSSSSSEPSEFQPLPSKVYKAIIAIGIAGEEESVTRFVALWIADAEKRAHQINRKIFKGSLQLLPLPEETG